MSKMWGDITLEPVIGTSIEQAASAATLYATYNKEQQFRLYLSFNGAHLKVAEYDHPTKEFQIKKSWEIIKAYDDFCTKDKE